MFSTLRRLYNFIKWGLAKEGGWMDDLTLWADELDIVATTEIEVNG